MTWYFRATNATRLYRIGDRTFKFEPAVLISSTWVGIYKTDDEGDAEALVSYGGAIAEIEESVYEEFKKKRQSYTVLQELVTPKEEKKEKLVVVDLNDEIKVGKATYKDSLETKKT